MLLTAEIKDDNYTDLPRAQEVQTAPPAAQYLKADVSTGQNYVDLNAAAHSYSGPWLFGRQHIQITVGDTDAQWDQWLPVPAGIADGVMLRGNVIYENPNGSYRMSDDRFEGVIRTEAQLRYFEGRTQHTFVGANPMRVAANLTIPFTQVLPYNPMVVLPSKQIAVAQSPYQAEDQEPDAGF